MSGLEIMIHKDKPQGNSVVDKKRRNTTANHRLIQPTPAPKSVMTIPISARRPNHNKWEAVMSKMAETKHRPINVKDVKSKVFNTKVSVIPSHPSSAHRVQEKEQQDPTLLKMATSKGSSKLTPRGKSDRNRLPKLIKETYSSQSSTLSSSSEEQHSHPQRHSKLLKQSSSTSCTSTGTVITPSCRSPAPPPPDKTPPNNKGHDSSGKNNAKCNRAIPGTLDIQSLRAELSSERESRERILQENKSLRLELQALLEAQEAASLGRQALELELSAAERRLEEARSDWQREREHAWEETEASRRAHTHEIQRLSKTHQSELRSLRESQQAEFELLKSSNNTDLNQLRASFEFREIELEQKLDFEIEEIKAKHVEDLENLESRYKVEIELLQQKVKDQEHPIYGFTHASSKENTTDLLHKEITSLTVVVELRNNEIKDLRQEVMSQRLELERLQGVDDQNHMLVQRVEDLQAQVQKTRNDKKKLIVENQTMETSMHEAQSAKEKLSMELDYLRYRIEETGDGPDSPRPVQPT